MHDVSKTDLNKELIAQYKTGNASLANTIIENNLGLVRAVLNRHRWLYGDNNSGVVDYDDFYQEGVISLYGALEGYDSDKAEFSTYAYKTIHQALYRFYYNKGSLIRKPDYKYTEYGRVRKAEDEYYQLHGEQPKLKDLSLSVGMSPDNILELRRDFQGVQSLDTPLGESDDLSLSNIIPDNTDFLEGIERKMTIEALREDLDLFMENLIPDKEDKLILKQCYAWHGGKPNDFKRIARIYRYSESHIRRRVQKSVITLSRNREYLAKEYIELLSTLTRTSSMDILGGKFSRNVTSNTVEAVMNPGQTLNLIRESNGTFITILDVENTYFDYVRVKDRGTELESVVDRIRYSSIKDYRTENGVIVEIYI